jgi:hypothetical protein
MPCTRPGVREEVITLDIEDVESGSLGRIPALSEEARPGMRCLVVANVSEAPSGVPWVGKLASGSDGRFVSVRGA